MKTTCPHCHTEYDIPDRMITAHNARIMQRRGRALCTPAQQAAARANGARGGRPRKPATP